MERRFGFTLTGIQPLLMHQDDVWQADELEAWRKHPDNKHRSKAGDDRSPPWTWMTYLYSDGTHVAMPSANIMVALRTAGTQLILKGNKTFKELTQSGLLIFDEFCEFTVRGRQIPVTEIEKLRDREFLEHRTAVEQLGFTLYCKRARVGQSKHIRVRPRFDAWSVTGSIEVLSDAITDEILADLFKRAGRCGLNDWRPSSRTPGPFGMFAADVQAS